MNPKYKPRRPKYSSMLKDIQRKWAFTLHRRIDEDMLNLFKDAMKDKLYTNRLRNFFKSREGSVIRYE